MVPQTDPTIALLEDLVAIDSVNPSLVAGAPGEADRAAAVVDPEGREDALLTRIESAGDAGDTVIAFALAAEP